MQFRFLGAVSLGSDAVSQRVTPFWDLVLLCLRSFHKGSSATAPSAAFKAEHHQSDSREKCVNEAVNEAEAEGSSQG